GYEAKVNIHQNNKPAHDVNVTVNSNTLFDTQTVLPRLSNDKEDIKRFEKLFETWSVEKKEPVSVEAYCQDLCNGIRKKELIEFLSSDQVLNMSLQLENYCDRINRP